MVVNKPTIIIYTNDPDQEFLHEICSGIEEEGLLYEIHERAGELAIFPRISTAVPSSEIP